MSASLDGTIVALGKHSLSVGKAGTKIRTTHVDIVQRNSDPSGKSGAFSSDGYAWTHVQTIDIGLPCSLIKVELSSNVKMLAVGCGETSNFGSWYDRLSGFVTIYNR